MKKFLFACLGFQVIFLLNSCTIETTKKSDGIKIEISTNDELVINGEKINDKKLDREIKRLIRDLEKEGLSKEEIKASIESGKESVNEALEELKKELEEIKIQNRQEKEFN